MAVNIPHKTALIQAILDACPGVEKIFLFGSRARGDNRNPHADIDIGIIGDRKADFSVLAKIETALDRLDTLYSIDISDFTERNDAFSEQAFSEMVILYEKR